MRKGIFGSMAALAAGAGVAWGQPEPAAVGKATVGSGTFAAMAAARPAADPMVVPASGGPLGPSPVIMPPLPGVPPGGPPGSGYDNGGPPPAPQYPPPGPYGAPLAQSSPGPAHGGGALGGGTDLNTFLAPKAWTSFDYLLLKPREQTVPFPLATTGPVGGSGLLGAPGTRARLAGPFGYDAASGFRATTGFFYDANRRFGFEASGFSVEPVNTYDSITVPANGTLVRPFTDSTTGLASGLVVGGLGRGNGDVVVGTSSNAWGIEGNGILNLYRTPCDSTFQFGFDVLAGVRYFQLTEDLYVSSNTVVTGANLPAGFGAIGPGSVRVTDSFVTRNRFTGGQLGVRSTLRYGMFSWLTTGKLAAGGNQQTADVLGLTTVTGGPGTATLPGGLFGNNMGRTTNNKGTYVSELNTALGISFTPTVTFTIGYNLIYAGDVLRPGGVINPRVDTALVPAGGNFGALGTTPVGNRLAQDDFVLQGLTLGLDLRY